VALRRGRRAGPGRGSRSDSAAITSYRWSPPGRGPPSTTGGGPAWRLVWPSPHRGPRPATCSPGRGQALPVECLTEERCFGSAYTGSLFHCYSRAIPASTALRGAPGHVGTNAGHRAGTGRGSPAGGGLHNACSCVAPGYGPRAPPGGAPALLPGRVPVRRRDRGYRHPYGGGLHAWRTGRWHEGERVVLKEPDEQGESDEPGPSRGQERQARRERDPHPQPAHGDRSVLRPWEQTGQAQVNHDASPLG
jgi:hypothetical protein